MVGTMTKEQRAPLVACILRNHLWATPQETEEWLKTESGKRISALLQKNREEQKK